MMGWMYSFIENIEVKEEEVDTVLLQVRLILNIKEEKMKKSTQMMMKYLQFRNKENTI